MTEPPNDPGSPAPSTAASTAAEVDAPDDASTLHTDGATPGVNRTLVAVVLVAGVVLSVASAVLLGAQNASERDQRLDEAARVVRAEVVGSFAQHRDTLVGVRAFLGSAEVSASEFDSFVSLLDLGEVAPGARVVGYAPEVDGTFPVALLSPLEGNEGTVGFDLAGDPRGRATLEAAASSGTPQLGSPFAVPGEDGGQERVANLFLPVYGGPVPAEADRRADRLQGVLLMTFSPSAALASSLADTSSTQVELYDLGSGAGRVEPTAQNLLWSTAGTQRAVDGDGGGTRLELDLGGRRWLVHVAPGPELASPDPLTPWLVLLLGLVITGLVAALILAVARARREALALADRTTSYLREREAELERANEDIVRSNRELERYASIAAHDLQEPLRSLLAYASVLERRYGETLEPEVLDQVQRMGRAAERMRSLVVDLLAYARADSQDRPIEMVDLNEAVRIAIDDLSMLIHDSGATIRISPLPTVPGNRRELIGVFSNLLSNALKYRSDQPPEVVVVAHQRDTEWLVGVRDNGLGIDPAYHERIFELFRRLEKRTSDSGTGLGLAICARTVAQHGGRIWVESVEGEGATFWFTLPMEVPGLSGAAPR